MKRFLLILAVAGAGACNKPTAEECKAAITNMRSILNNGAVDTASTADTEGEVRRCRGASTKDSVACATKARSRDELHACAFEAPKHKE